MRIRLTLRDLPERRQTQKEVKMISFDDFCREQPCYWNKDQKCTGGSYCDACEHQPPDDEKPNGKKEPVKIRWQNDYGMIMPYCPTCGEMAYGTERCKFCGQPFIHEEAPKNKQEIIGGTMGDDGIIVCKKCGNDSMKLVAHADGRGFFDYTYLCMKCENPITVRTYLNEFV